MTVGIMGAMHEEISGLLPFIQNRTSQRRGSREYHLGELEGCSVVLALSRMGKVAAASTATTMIDRYNAHSIIFTGVAGGVSRSIKRGDAVVASKLIQHDMDASPIMNFKRFEVPLLKTQYFETEPILRHASVAAARKFFSTDKRHQGCNVHEGIIASGDQFLADADRCGELCRSIPGLLAVEMEGAAVAQVCYEWNVPFVVIRSISDSADEKAVEDFPTFVKEMAEPLSEGVVRALLKSLPKGLT